MERKHGPELVVPFPPTFVWSLSNEHEEKRKGSEQAKHIYPCLILLRKPG